jgi:hypothetical protein
VTALRALPVFGALVLVGCGSATSSGNDVRDAAKATSEDTSRVEMIVQIPDDASFRGSGFFDYARERGSLRFEAEFIHEDAAEITRFTPDEVRLFADAHYISWFMDGKRYWSKEPAEASGDPLEFLIPAPGLSDPDDVLELLVNASGDIKRQGNEDVRGVETTHYRIRLDSEELVQQVPPAQREEARESLGARSLPVEVWTDRENRIRRVRFQHAGALKTTMTVELFDFGIEVEVEPPPPEQVLSDEEFDELLESSVLAKGKLPASSTSSDFCAEEDESQICVALAGAGNGALSWCAKGTNEPDADEVCAEVKKFCADLRASEDPQPRFCDVLLKEEK